jgi:hypothetical protein
LSSSNSARSSTSSSPGARAAREAQHVVHHAFEEPELREDLLRVALHALRFRAGVCELRGVQHGRGERRARLVREARAHLAHLREPCVALREGLEPALLGDVGEQDDAAGVTLQGACGDAREASVGELELRFRRPCDRALEHLTPGTIEERLAQQFGSARVVLADEAAPVEDDDAARQCLEQTLQPVREALLFRELRETLAARLGELAGEHVDALLQLVIGLLEEGRALVEGGEGLLELAQP